MVAKGWPAMIIEVEKGFPGTVERVRQLAHSHGNRLEAIKGSNIYDTLHLIGDTRGISPFIGYIESLPGVSRVWRITSGYKNIARVVSGEDGKVIHREARIVEITGLDGEVRRFGDGKHLFIAGPDSVQTEEQTFAQARRIASIADSFGIRDRVLLRGGAFKPRTRPTDFRGLGMEAIEILDRVREDTGLPYVSEVMDPVLVEELSSHVDCFQIGTRNAQDFTLLEAVGKSGKAVVLKRGFGNDAEEWFNAAEYIANQGNLDILLCERGVKTMFAGKGYNRFTPDLQVISYAREKTILPVLFDPSHCAGDDRLVAQTLLASLPFGPAGSLIEVIHSEEFRALQLCDARQALHLDVFERLVEAVLRFEAEVWPLVNKVEAYFRERERV